MNKLYLLVVAGVILSVSCLFYYEPATAQNKVPGKGQARPEIPVVVGVGSHETLRAAGESVRPPKGVNKRTARAVTVTIPNSPEASFINVTFDSSITGNVNAAAIEAMVNRAVSYYQAQYKDPITVNILFRYSTTAPNGSPLSAGLLARSDWIF